MIKKIFLFILLVSLPLIAMIDNKPSGLMHLYVASPNIGIAISLNGNVGIGTVSPVVALDVNGGVKVGNVSDCSSAKAGTIRWSGLHFEGCTGTAWKQMEYTQPPFITSITPALGSGSTVITIAGTGFTSGTQVTIGGVAATNVTWVSATQITATTPTNTTGGAKDVIVTNLDSGVAVKGGGFTYSVLATGGTITTSGVYRIHTFTSASTFAITSGGKVEVFVWGGGGAGGTVGGWTYGSYGGAGGAAQGTMNVTAGTSYTVVVGGGGVVNSYSSDFKCALGGGGCASNSNGDNRYCGGGGGYSGIFNSSVSQANALIIAGGGGGGGSVWSTNGTTTSQSGGAAGGQSGQIGYGEVDTSYKGQPGTQTSAGATASGAYMYQNGTGAIQGALQGGTTNSYSYGGGGGGGYWGGSAGAYFTGGPYPVNQMQGGGGGSGYYNPSSVFSGILTAGTGTTPGDSSNPLRGSYGNAGGYQGNGTAGIVVIRYQVN